MDPYTLAYWIMLAVGGLLLAVLSLAGHLHFGAGDDLGLDQGPDVSIHVDADIHGPGDLHVGEGGADLPHDASPLDAAHAGTFTFLSPIVWSTFLAMSGVAGVVATHVGVRGPWSMPPAFGTGLALSLAAMFGFNTLLRNVQGTSGFRAADLVGNEGEVITPVPARGYGEIALVVRSARRTGPAKSADRVDIPRGTKVTIVSVAGGTFTVRPTIDERLRLISPSEAEREGK